MAYLLALGVFLNGVVLLVFFRNKKHMNKNNAFPLSIILNGFCMASLSFILPTIAEFSGGFLNSFSLEVCIVEAFVVYMFGLASLLLNTAIAVYRNMVVSRPTGSVTITNMFMVKMVLLCEVAAIMFALCPLLGWGSYGLEAHGTSCGLAWSVGNLSYIITMGVVCYIVPFIVIVCSYTRIIRIVSTVTFILLLTQLEIQTCPLLRPSN